MQPPANPTPTNVVVVRAGGSISTASGSSLACEDDADKASAGPNGLRIPGSCATLEEAGVEELAEALTARLGQDRCEARMLFQEVSSAESRLAQKQQELDEMERHIFAVTDGLDDVIDVNVGGTCMSTTRAVLCSAKGSLLAGMFSGNFDSLHKRDKDGRIFLDADPALFAKLLSHMRLRRIASPDCPAPLPHITEDLRAEYDMMVKHFGLETFMYGDVRNSCNIFQRIAESSQVDQAKLQSKDIIRIILSSTGGVAATNHEDVFGPEGFREKALENSYGLHPNTIMVRFLKNWVIVESMQLRAKVSDVVLHMSQTWTFRQGSERPVSMGFHFTKQEPCTPRLEVTGGGTTFVDEIAWCFPRDFCLEHIVLYGRVLAK